jgi:hypothetical protein
MCNDLLGVLLLVRTQLGYAGAKRSRRATDIDHDGSVSGTQPRINRSWISLSSRRGSAIASQDKQRGYLCCWSCVLWKVDTDCETYAVSHGQVVRYVTPSVGFRAVGRVHYLDRSRLEDGCVQQGARKREITLQTG